jgi:opacity protein-like surface antigen
MRKISVLLFFASMMMAMPSQAQLVKFGVKGGLNLTKMDMDQGVDASNRTGFFFGPTMIIALPLTGLDIDASALYDYRESKVEAYGVSENLKQQQIAIPVNVRYGFGIGDVARVFAFAGPQFGFVIDKEQSIKQVADWKLKTSNFSVNVGIGAMVLKHLQATVNYNIACGKTGEITVRDTGHAISKGKSNSWQLGLAYIF